jgi:hypothetical protein
VMSLKIRPMSCFLLRARVGGICLVGRPARSGALRTAGVPVADEKSPRPGPRASCASDGSMKNQTRIRMHQAVVPAAGQRQQQQAWFVRKILISLLKGT